MLQNCNNWQNLCAFHILEIFLCVLPYGGGEEGVYRNESSIINLGDAERPGTHWAYAKQEDRADPFTSSSSIVFFMFELKNCVEHVYFELCQYNYVNK